MQLESESVLDCVFGGCFCFSFFIKKKVLDRVNLLLTLHAQHVHRAVCVCTAINMIAAANCQDDGGTHQQLAPRCRLINGGALLRHVCCGGGGGGGELEFVITPQICSFAQPVGDGGWWNASEAPRAAPVLIYERRYLRAACRQRYLMLFLYLHNLYPAQFSSPSWV